MATRQQNQSDHIQRRLRLFIIYGGKCANCPEKDFAKLDIHHVEGGGNLDRKDAGGGSNSLRDLLKYFEQYGRPKEGLELLCLSCHAKKRRETANRELLSATQTCNILNWCRVTAELCEGGLSRLVENEKIKARQVSGVYEFKAQSILDYACSGKATNRL